MVIKGDKIHFTLKFLKKTPAIAGVNSYLHFIFTLLKMRHK